MIIDKQEYVGQAEVSQETKETATNALYLYGVLEESKVFQDWKLSQPESYKIYRKNWMTRPSESKFGDYPLSLNVEVTTRCNLACTFCWHRELDGGAKFDMDYDLFKKVIDESAENSIPAVNLNGLGEPLMHPQLIDMIKYCKKKGIPEVMFHTNATIMNEKIAKELIDAGLDVIIFSLDSPNKETYEGMRIKASFDSVQKNVETFLKVRNQMKNIKPFVRATMVLTDKTVDQVDDFIAKWTNKVDAITVQDLLFAANSDSGGDDDDKFRGEENSRITINTKTIMGFQKVNNIAFKCPYLYQSLKIKSSGNVVACSPREAPHLGHVNDSLKGIWHGDTISYLREKHEKGEWMDIKECASCDIPYMEINRMMNDVEFTK